MNIRDTYKEIYTHFGEEVQLNKLLEEANELVEAVKEGDCDHIEEELADIYVVCCQIQLAFDLNIDRIDEIMGEKIVRTLERIKSGYYENCV